jgi:hypothetical protein
MHDESIKEEVTVTVNVNGEDMEPIKMPVFKEGTIYTLSMDSMYQGHVWNKEHSKATYSIMVRLERRKTHKEEGKEDATS